MVRRIFYLVLFFAFSQFLFTSCWWSASPKFYNINEDYLFFTKMPPRTQSGEDIFAFEIDGKSYVFPARGSQKKDWFIYARKWDANLSKEGEDGYKLYFRVDRSGKKFNPVYVRFICSFSDTLRSGNNGYCEASALGSLQKVGWNNSWYDSYQISWYIDSLDTVKRFIAGRFSCVLVSEHDTTDRMQIENGFFDLLYE